MPKKYNVMVTAVGGDIGQSVARVLRRLDMVRTIVGTDMSNDHPGSFFVDAFFQVPPANVSSFIPSLEAIIAKYQIDFLIPISEPEIKTIHEAHASGWSPARLVIPQGLTLPTCLDKFETIQFLGARGISVPWTTLTTQGMPPEFPCILKDRLSWGSKSIVIIDDMETARWYASRRPNGLFQELLLPDDQEYTCGVFRSRTGKIATVVFRRTLSGAQTGKATVVVNQVIEELCTRIAHALQLRGSINVQLRNTAKGPIPFEINARFSSTVIFRELIGFRDVLWSFLDVFGQDFDCSFLPPVGTRIYRVFNEIVIPHKPEIWKHQSS